MFTYQQSTGNLISSRNTVLATGYAGRGVHKNDPASENLASLGPLPCGMYTIGGPYESPHTGEYTLNLVPDSKNAMFGRCAFRIHGDSIFDPGNASDGCVVMPKWARLVVWESGDHQLQVVPGPAAEIPI